MVVGALGVFVALLGLTFWLARARGPGPVVERPPVSILIADFDNKTGETVFDGALEQALSLGMEGASFVVAYPRGTAVDVAGRMGLTGGLSEETARLVSRREDINFIVAGTIARDGNAYRLTARAVDAQAESGKSEPIATATAEADSKTDVLAAMGALASTLRTELGATTEEEARLARAETVTPVRSKRSGPTCERSPWPGEQIQEALAAYQEAVRLDPNFGRAYAGMGVDLQRSSSRADESRRKL